MLKKLEKIVENVKNVKNVTRIYKGKNVFFLHIYGLSFQQLGKERVTDIQRLKINRRSRGRRSEFRQCQSPVYSLLFTVGHGDTQCQAGRGYTACQSPSFH